MNKLEMVTNTPLSAPIIVPSYAAILLVQKLWDAFQDHTFDLISAASTALCHLLKTSPPSFILLSLADFKARVQSIRQNAYDIFTVALQSGTSVIMDSGGLEKSMLPLLNEGPWLQNPIDNIEAQLTLGNSPKIVTLLDNLDLTCTFEHILHNQQDLLALLTNTRKMGIEVLLVLHDRDFSTPQFAEILDSNTMSQIDYIAIPDEELIEGSDFLRQAKQLDKPLAVFGLDDMCPDRLTKLAKEGVYLADVLRWVTGRIGVGGFDGSAFDDITTWRKLSIAEIQNILYSNLLALQRLSS